MKNINKENKGITLIALIVTIIVTKHVEKSRDGWYNVGS